MFKFKNFALFSVLLLSITTAQAAGVLIEPLIGYNLGTKVEIEDYKSYSGGSGMAYGGRLGYQNFGFQLGLDYLKSNLDMGHKHFKKDLTTDEFAGFVGFEFPILLRVYAGYIFSGMGEAKEYQNPVTTILEKAELKGGTGPKLGVGFTVLPFLDINLEYRQVTYDEFKLAGVKQTNEVKLNSYLLSLSLPFNL